MKNVIKLIINGLCILALGLYLINNSINTFSKFDSKIKSHIGNKVIIDKDTLMITDYSIIDENYTLSDGNKISFELLKDVEIHEKKK